MGEVLCRPDRGPQGLSTNFLDHFRGLGVSSTEVLSSSTEPTPLSTGTLCNLWTSLSADRRGAGMERMTQALELTFDRRADEAIRAQWEDLRAAGLPSMARHTAPTNRPHLTLDTREVVPPEVEEALGPVALRLPVEVLVGAPLLFHARRRWVLTRHVVMDRALLELHAHALGLLGHEVGSLTSPGRWVPHVTLARGVTDEQLPAALKLVSTAAPVKAIALRLRRWDSAQSRAWDVEPD